jgi:hypothetical protein
MPRPAHCSAAVHVQDRKFMLQPQTSAHGLHWTRNLTPFCEEACCAQRWNFTQMLPTASLQCASVCCGSQETLWLSKKCQLHCLLSVALGSQRPPKNPSYPPAAHRPHLVAVFDRVFL